MKCPKCNTEMVWEYTWIEYQGIGHLGLQTWICKVCNYVEPIKIPEMKTVVFGDSINWRN